MSRPSQHPTREGKPPKKTIGAPRKLSGHELRKKVVLMEKDRANMLQVIKGQSQNMIITSKFVRDLFKGLPPIYKHPAGKILVLISKKLLEAAGVPDEEKVFDAIPKEDLVDASKGLIEKSHIYKPPELPKKDAKIKSKERS